MYPFIRVFYTIYTAKSRPKVGLSDTSILPMSVHLTDLDIYGEMNNARYLNIMEMGRWDMSVRMGFLDALRRNHWGLAVGGCSIRYRKRLTALQKFDLHSRLAAYDDKWLYVQQDIFRQGVQHTGALLRTAVISKQGIVPTEKVFEAMNVEWQPYLPEWVQAWDRSDQDRPWH